MSRRTSQTFFNWAVLALLAMLALNTASIARSLRRIERKDRHPTPVWFLMKAPTLEGGPPADRVCARCPNKLDVTTLPLWMWTHQRTLPTLQACERHRAASTRMMRCIASDDPRLKEPIDWQLLLPPYFKGVPAMDTTAFLSQWTWIKTFPTENECLAQAGDALANYRFQEQEKAKALARMGIHLQRLSREPSGASPDKEEESLRCVASNDPGFWGKKPAARSIHQREAEP
jgi:hypothetical protein